MKWLALVTALFVMLFLTGITAAHTVTMTFSFRIANETDFSIRVNDTTYNKSTPVAFTFTSLKKYISANNTTTVFAAVPTGSLLNIRLNSSFNATHSSFEVTQDSNNHRLLLAATNGTYTDIEDKLTAVDTARMVSSVFGRFVTSIPASFRTFIRLEFTNLDLDRRAEWSGSGQLRITNRGLTSRNVPNITLEVIQ